MPACRSPRQQGMFILTLSEPQLALLSEQQRISIHSKALINTTLGLQGNGRVTVNGKVRYEPSDYSFYIDDPQVTAISIDGLSPSLEPQLINLAQQALQPALEGQPVYTLSDQDMSESMARMMLKSMTIDGSDMVLELSPVLTHKKNRPLAGFLSALLSDGTSYAAGYRLSYGSDAVTQHRYGPAAPVSWPRLPGRARLQKNSCAPSLLPIICGSSRPNSATG